MAAFNIVREGLSGAANAGDDPEGWALFLLWAPEGQGPELIIFGSI